MPILPCSAPDCDKPIHVKKHSLCQSHCNRFYAYGDLNLEPVPTECVGCGDAIARPRKAKGPALKYCTKKCQTDVHTRRFMESGRYESELAAKRAASAAKPKLKQPCIECGGEFESNRRVSKYCSSKCQNSWTDKHNPARCSESDCVRGVRAKGLCNMHWRRKARAEGRESNPDWDERRKANYQKRRALKLNLPAETIRPIDVYERDGWMCGICHDPVDRGLAYPDPLSASLDHVLPLSRGGHHVMENVTLAHLQCNVQKGAKVS